MKGKVIIFLPSFETGGVERNAVYCANGLVENGFDVYVVYCRKLDERFSLLDGRVNKVEVARVRLPIFHERIIDALNMLLFAPKVLLCIRRNGRVAIISFQSNIIAIILARLCRIPIAVRLSNHFSVVNYENGLLRKASELGKRLTYRFADAVISNSSELAEDYAPLLKRKITTIPNPVDFDRISKLMKMDVSEGLFLKKRRPIIISAGRLAIQKNFQLLLRVMAKVVPTIPCDLVILGEGSERGCLERLARELGIDEFVHLFGYRENIYRYFRRSDLFVLSSNYEGMPNVLIEAVACGVPVVATCCKTGPVEILCGGEGGRLVPVNDSESLSEAIVKSLTESSITEKMKHISKMSLSRYDHDMVNERYMMLVCELFGKAYPII